METVKTVFFGLIGVRRKADHEKAEIRPLQVIVVAGGFRRSVHPHAADHRRHRDQLEKAGGNKNGA